MEPVKPLGTASRVSRKPPRLKWAASSASTSARSSTSVPQARLMTRLRWSEGVSIAAANTALTFCQRSWLAASNEASAPECSTSLRKGEATRQPTYRVSQVAGSSIIGLGSDAMTNSGGDDAGDITVLLSRLQKGDKGAEGELVTKVYPELRKLAVAYMRRERQGHTLQPTALVNEAYLKLAGLKRLRWQDRAHFFGVAARLMRQVLVDYARGRNAEKRGGGVVSIPVSRVPIIARDEASPTDILAIHQALEALAARDPRTARVVECRFFTGLSVEETAAALGIAERTVKRDWQFGRAWLRQHLDVS